MKSQQNFAMWTSHHGKAAVEKAERSSQGGYRCEERFGISGFVLIRKKTIEEREGWHGSNCEEQNQQNISRGKKKTKRAQTEVKKGARLQEVRREVFL